MKFAQSLGLFVLIALGAPAPKLPGKWVAAIRASDVLAARAAILEEQGTRLEELPVVPLKELEAGVRGVVCDEVRVEEAYVGVCLAGDAVYFEMLGSS